MSAFQPGDVVRLTGRYWSDTLDSLPGSTQIILGWDTYEQAYYFDFGGARWFVCEGFEAEHAGGLSPQAALDAILEHQYAIDEWHAVPVKNADEDVVWLTARKVDGHWQVKSVGGGE